MYRCVVKNKYGTETRYFQLNITMGKQLAVEVNTRLAIMYEYTWLHRIQGSNEGGAPLSTSFQTQQKDQNKARTRARARTGTRVRYY